MSQCFKKSDSEAILKNRFSTPNNNHISPNKLFKLEEKAGTTIFYIYFFYFIIYRISTCE